MNKQSLSDLMRLAWRFFHITGQSFSECLRQAWANFKLVRAMRKGIVRFYFKKVDGTIREAWGTLKADLVPPVEGDSKRKPNDTVQTYYDTERQEWRCFKRLNLISIA